MKRFRPSYFESAREIVKKLHPAVKPLIKEGIESLNDNPYRGKELEDEFLGFRSLAIGNYRVIYRMNETLMVIEIHFIGHRRDVYSQFRAMLEKEKSLIH